MTEAVKRHLRRAERNCGGVWCVTQGYGLRSIMTICAMRDQGLVERHPHAGDVLSPKGLAARERLLAKDAGGNQASIGTRTGDLRERSAMIKPTQRSVGSDRESVPPEESRLKMAGWKRVEPYQGEKHHGCLNCGPTEDVAPMDMVIGVGFGSAYASKDGEVVYDEMTVMHGGGDFDDLATLQQIEDMAVADPDHDWRVVLHGPLRGREYQRHGAAQWVLINSDQGFA